MTKIQVLMSTYNGKNFIREQIDSVLHQTCEGMELLIRDDGSTDDTLAILKEYEEKYPNIHVIYGKNIGVTASFFSLLAESDARYVAFCDQDDIWLPEKLEKAIEKMQGVEGPVLYASNKILVDSAGQIISECDDTVKTPSFQNALVECICTGCTMVMNRPLTIILQSSLPQNAVIHDWWCYLTAAYFGTVIYDSNAYIYYRQHGNNVIGASQDFVQKLKFNVNYVLKNKGRLKKQLQEFQEFYGSDVEKERNKMLKDVLKADKFPGRFTIMFSRSVKRQSFVDEMIMRLLFLFHIML